MTSAVKGGVTTNYKYNADGLRTEKQVGGILSLMFDYMDGKNDSKVEISLRPTIIIC